LQPTWLKDWEEWDGRLARLFFSFPLLTGETPVPLFRPPMRARNI
jgi:hypothetical protein